MNPVQHIAAAGTAVIFNPWTAEGRINSASTKLDEIDKRYDDFLKKAVPILQEKFPNESICDRKSLKTTTRALNKLALRRNTLAGSIKREPFWQRLSPFFRSGEIGELEVRLVEWDDTTLMSTTKASKLMNTLPDCSDSDSDDETCHEASEKESAVPTPPSRVDVNAYLDRRRQSADDVDESSEVPPVQAGLHRTSSTSTIRAAVD